MKGKIGYLINIYPADTMRLRAPIGGVWKIHIKPEDRRAAARLEVGATVRYGAENGRLTFMPEQY